MAKARAYFRGEIPDWHHQAACRPMSWEGQEELSAKDAMFFPTQESRKVANQAAEEYCNTCPVKLECLQDALAGEVYGIYAGTCTSDRRRMDRKRSRVKCPLCHSRSIVHKNATDTKPPEEFCISCGGSWRADLFPAPNAEVLDLPRQAVGEQEAEELGLTA